jgi:hypothetical protein
MRRLQEREGEVLAEARQAWLSFGVWSGDPERRSGMASFLEKYRDVTLSEDAITRFVVVSEIDQARLLVASPDEEEGGLNPTLESRHLQISEEIKTLARRNAYKGVEAQFRELLTLVDKGVRPRFEDCLHGAEAARALGDAQATRERLLMALSLSPSTDVKEWLNEVERSYARVRIVNDTRRSLELKPSKAPFAPDQRAALDFARAALDQDGRFDGLLPMGVYHFGKRVFVVVPGDPPVEVRLRR